MGAHTKQEQEPAADDVYEVAPGVLRMQLPIRFPGLGHVNTYALLDDRGAAVVDPGLPGPGSWNVLRRRLAAAGLQPRDVHTVLVTHAHPDHFGGAGRLAREGGGAIITHSAFRTWWGGAQPCDHEVHDVDAADLHTDAGWATRTPWGGEGFRPPLRRRLAYRMMQRSGGKVFAPPHPTRRVRDGERLRLARREWVVVHTPGHTLDHVCLLDPEHGVLLSGDHVLPTITPHIAGVGGGRDPLAAFLRSLHKVAALPDVGVVLPAHGHPFTNLAGRVADIRAHHEGRIERLRTAAAALGPTTVQALSRELFRPERWGPMAESETYAHLEYLRCAGAAERHERDGMYVYDIAAG